MSGSDRRVQQPSGARRGLARFLDSDPRRSPRREDERDSEQGVLGTLASMGAPLIGVTAYRCMPLEVALLRAVDLARHNGTVFRVLPLVLLRAEGELDWPELKSAALELEVAQELGLLASLAGKLGDRPSLAERVVDLKNSGQRPNKYFPEARSSFERTLAEERSPPIALEWGFYVNVSEASLRSTITKHGACALTER